MNRNVTVFVILGTVAIMDIGEDVFVIHRTLRITDIKAPFCGNKVGVVV